MTDARAAAVTAKTSGLVCASARPIARRRSFAAIGAPTVSEAAEDVARARVTLDRVRRDVAHRRDGSASLTVAEHGLHVAPLGPPHANGQPPDHDPHPCDSRPSTMNAADGTHGRVSDTPDDDRPESSGDETDTTDRKDTQ